MIRTILATSVLLASLMLLLPARGQQQGASFFTGVNPRQLNFKPIDVSHANRATNMSNMMRTPKQPQNFVLSNMFRSISMPTWPPKVASTPILKESPYTKIIFPKKDKKK